MGGFSWIVSDCEELLRPEKTIKYDSSALLFSEDEGVLDVDGSSRRRSWEDDLPNLCPKAALEHLV